MAKFVKPLQDLFDDDWRWEMQDNPEFAYQAGHHDEEYESGKELQNVTPAAYLNRARHSEEMVDSIRAIQREYPLSAKEKMYASLFEALHLEVSECIRKCPLFLCPINSMSYGAVGFSFSESIEWMRFESVRDYEKYHKRLLAFPRQIDDFIVAMKEGIKVGVVAAAEIVRNVEAQFEEIISSDLGKFYAPLLAPDADKILADENKLKEAIGRAIDETKTAFRLFLDFFKMEYLPHVRTTVGCSSLPNGEEMYGACLRFHTTTNLTAEEVHQVGLAEVAKIEARYRSEVLIPLGFDPDDFPAFVEFVRSDKQFYVGSGEALLDVYTRLCANIQLILPEYFTEIPSSPLEITSCQGGPAAYYLAGTADGKRPGRFYVNVSHIEQRPTYESVALALHEAVPGHHHQISLALENENIPQFLRYTEDRRYEICPCRRNLLSSFMEGWGLYSELLGEEMGLYETPYDLYGRLSMEMMRAVRLVVDTGIHAKGWSIEQSIDYMMDKTGMHRHEVESEIYRYASWPGQACSYKIGQLEILRLRSKAQTALGSSFRLRDFHSVCLGTGPVPLSLLATLVDEYIAEKLASSTTA